MLLKALYDYAEQHHLLAEGPLQKRDIYVLIPLDANGKLRFDHLIPLTHTDKKGKERPGQEHLMPRFPGENNGGKAYFLAENPIAVLGRDKVTGDPIQADSKKSKNPTKAFEHFWSQIKEAHESTHDPRLAALLAFRSIYLIEHDGKIVGNLPFLEVRQNKSGNPELVAKTGQNDLFSLKSATIGFSIEGNLLTMKDEADPLREYWFKRYRSEAFQEESEGESSDATDDSKPLVCLITGQIGKPIARSHKPKILGVPGLSSGGYIVSFAKEAPAFSSYGLEMGQNAPVSEQAAAAYALALNKLLQEDDTHLNIGPLSVCFWSKSIKQAPGQFKSMLDKAYPEQVSGFLRAPFAGVVDREVLKKERLYTVVLAGNAGRVVVQHWLDQTLDEAIDHFKDWWKDLQITSLYQLIGPDNKESVKKQGSSAPPPSPFAIFNLSRATLRQSKGQKTDKLVRERIVQLYRAAIEGTSLPLSMLKPILDELHSALVKDSEEKRTHPFSQSRFALIKLLLIRNRKEDEFMPTYELADTPDPAYNLGRLLAVFENLQDKYHNYEKKGPGVVERYYAAASSAPSSAFPILCRLARHHLSKVRREDEKAAYWIEKRITEVMSKFQAISLGKPPVFPRVLTLEEQGRFALGFYQQKASRGKAIEKEDQPTKQLNETLQIINSEKKGGTP